MYKIICSVVFAIFLIQSFSLALAAVKCYSCSTSLNPGCGNPFEGAGYQECATSSSQTFNCVKYSHIVGNNTIVFRGCRTASDTCEVIKAALIAEGTEVVSCNLCSENLCNSVNSLRFSLITTFFFLIILIAL